MSGARAFEILIKASQDSNIKLREVAGFVVEHAGQAKRSGTGGPGVTIAGTPGP